MRIKLFSIFAFLLCAPTVANQLVITEIFANSAGNVSDVGKEWFEVYNPSDQPVNIDGSVIWRLDGEKGVEAWRFLVKQDVEVAPGQYALIAQSADLGLGFCLDVPIAVIEDPAFRLKNVGVQKLCIQTAQRRKDCGRFSNSTLFPDGHSRYSRGLKSRSNDSLSSWRVETCEFVDHFFATPGFRANICEDPAFALRKHVVSCRNRDSFPDRLIEQLQIEPGLPPEVAIGAVTHDKDEVTIKYQAYDEDPGDLIDASLYYSQAPKQPHGTLISSQILPTAPEGGGQFLWDVRNVLPGEYFVFGKAIDRYGNVSYGYFDEPVVIKKRAVVEPSIKIIGAKVLQGYRDKSIEVQWQVTPAVDGNVSIWLKHPGLKWRQPIAAGLWAKGDGPFTFIWQIQPSDLSSAQIGATLYWGGGKTESHPFSLDGQ